MPATAKRHAMSPTTRAQKITPITETAKLPVQQLAKLVNTIGQNAKDQLESRFESFLRDAMPEEVRFMDGVLMDFDNFSRFGGEPESPLSRKLPIFNAIHRQMNASVSGRGSGPRDGFRSRELHRRTEEAIERSETGRRPTQ